MMDFLKEPKEPPELFFSLVDRTMHGLIGFAALHAASSLQVFDHIEKSRGSTLLDLAGAVGIEEETLSPLLDVLVRCGVLIHKNGRYTNSRLASTYLVPTSPFCQISHLRKNAAFLGEIWACLPERLVNGPVVFQAGKFFSELALPAMAENALAGRLQRTVRVIAGMPEFRASERMLDLGGGHGLYAIALATLNPGLSAYIFDLPHIVPLADHYITHYRAKRVFTIPGNFFSDHIGTGYDLILSSSNPSGKSIELLAKIASALNNGGLFVNVQSDTREGEDAYHALEWQLWTLDHQGKGKGLYTKEKPFMNREYRAAMAGEGLEVILETDIRDDVHKGSSVRMVIAKKT